MTLSSPEHHLAFLEASWSWPVLPPNNCRASGGLRRPAAQRRPWVAPGCVALAAGHHQNKLPPLLLGGWGWGAWSSLLVSRIPLGQVRVGCYPGGGASGLWGGLKVDSSDLSVPELVSRPELTEAGSKALLQPWSATEEGLFLSLSGLQSPAGYRKTVF